MLKDKVSILQIGYIVLGRLSRGSVSPDNGAKKSIDPKIGSAEHLQQRNFLVRVSGGRLRLHLFVQLLPSRLHLRESSS